jgi:ferredoxin-NADP reductase
MNQREVNVISAMHITHDVFKIVTERPEMYEFIPRQATEISIKSKSWKKLKTSFTFTCHPDSNYLEFIIKIYQASKSIYKKFLHLKQDDVLILNDVFGSAAYQGEGVFIAGGSGVSQYISIFRHLHSEGKIGRNKLIFANKTKNDIIFAREFKELFGGNFINIISDEEVQGFSYGPITAGFLNEHMSSANHVYLCGPPPMMEAVEIHLAKLNDKQKSIIAELLKSN